jgi:hypothetical protein
MIGLRPQHFPTKEEDVFLFKYIRNKYGKHSIDELYLAFDLAINNKLDIDDYKVYDQFSIEYLVRIMNAYRRYSGELLMEEQPKLLIEQTSRVIPREEKKADIEELINAQHYDVRKIPMYMYDWMVELGYIQHTDDDKYAMYDKAIKQRYRDLRVAYESNYGNREAKAEFINYKKMMEDGFKDLTKAEESAIESVYRKLSVIEVITKTKNKKQ